MSLGGHDQQALDSIEEGLARSDPRLTSLLATFGRLTAGEELPVRERIRAGHWRVSRGRRGRPRRPRRHLIWPFLWLAVSFALVAIALTAGRGGKAACAQWAACPVPVVAHAAGQTAPGPVASQAVQPRVGAATGKG